MIFATVGTQLPFPRLMLALDRIAEAHGLSITAQTAEPHASYPHLNATAHLHPAAFGDHVRRASILVGHAGIGTVLTARKLAKPLIVLPRRASLGEHRNEHQLATAKVLNGLAGIYVAWEERDLERWLTSRELAGASAGSSPDRDRLNMHIRKFIEAQR